MNTMKVVGFGLFAVAVYFLWFEPPRPVGAAPNCTEKCSETQYFKDCKKSAYVYLTKTDCLMCDKTISKTYCDDRMKPDNCKDASEKIRAKAVTTNTDVCPCTVGATNYDYVEASSVKEPNTMGSETNRYTCQAPPQ
ncbi:MAG: hypothetical protein K2X87_23935 [Gemmataceae bacterium]|nr:hypothetical protein [Gemmataceae bacterium]